MRKGGERDKCVKSVNPIPGTKLSERKEELVTVKVKKHVYDGILEIQAILALQDHKKHSQSDIIEYALSKLPQIGVQLSEKFTVIEAKKK